MTLLHIACAEGHEALAKWLLSKKKVSADVRDSQGWTPLHCAAHAAHWDLVLLLAKKGTPPPLIVPYS